VGRVVSDVCAISKLHIIVVLMRSNFSNTFTMRLHSGRWMLWIMPLKC